MCTTHQAFRSCTNGPIYPGLVELPVKRSAAGGSEPAGGRDVVCGSNRSCAYHALRPEPALAAPGDAAMRKGGMTGDGAGAGGGPGWHIARPSQLPWRIPIDQVLPHERTPVPPVRPTSMPGGPNFRAERTEDHTRIPTTQRGSILRPRPLHDQPESVDDPEALTPRDLLASLIPPGHAGDCCTLPARCEHLALSQTIAGPGPQQLEAALVDGRRSPPQVPSLLKCTWYRWTLFQRG